MTFLGTDLYYQFTDEYQHGFSVLNMLLDTIGFLKIFVVFPFYSWISCSLFSSFYFTFSGIMKLLFHGTSLLYV